MVEPFGWPRSPRAIDDMNLWATAGNGPVKYPEVRINTDRVDVQAIGPAEALDLQTECGSGLCQQLAGDFLFHCHVAHHYVAGMWGYWRVYNTLQIGELPPGQHGHHAAAAGASRPEGADEAGAVTSDKLVGKTMDWYETRNGEHRRRTKATGPKSRFRIISIKDWVKMMLPPAGQPGHTSDEKGQVVAYDATVLDWTWDGNKVRWASRR